MEKKKRLYSPGELAGILGIPRNTVHYFRKHEIIKPKLESEHIHLYDFNDLVALAFAHEFFSAGFNTKEIGQLIKKPCREDKRNLIQLLRENERLNNIFIKAVLLRGKPRKRTLNTIRSGNIILWRNITPVPPEEDETPDHRVFDLDCLKETVQEIEQIEGHRPALFFSRDTDIWIYEIIGFLEYETGESFYPVNVGRIMPPRPEKSGGGVPED